MDFSRRWKLTKFTKKEENKVFDEGEKASSSLSIGDNRMRREVCNGRYTNEDLCFVSRKWIEQRTGAKVSIFPQANLKQKGETRWFFEVALALGIGKGSCKNSYCQKNRVIETEGRNGTKRRILFVLRTSTSTNELSLTRNRLRDKMC